MTTILLNAVPNADVQENASASVHALLFILLMLVVCGGIIVLQVFLSKQESKWLGLILPGISVFISLLVFLAIVLFSAVTAETATYENGVLVEQEQFQPIQTAEPAAIIFTAINLFLIYNVPTIVLLAVYAACRSRKNKQRALDKMNVQDLE